MISDLSETGEIADLSKEEILNQVALTISDAGYTGETDAGATKEAIDLFREEFAKRGEMPLEIEILSHRVLFSQQSLKLFYDLYDEMNFYTLYRLMIHYYQFDVDLVVYWQRLVRVYEPNLTYDRVKEILLWIESPIPLDTGEEDQTESSASAAFSEERTTIPDEERPQVKRDADLMQGPGINSIVHYLYSLLTELSDFLPKPDYVKEFEIDLSALPSLPIPPEEVTPEEVVEALLDFGGPLVEVSIPYIKRENFRSQEEFDLSKRREVRDTVLTKIKKYSPDQLLAVYVKILIPDEKIKLIEEDKSLFRILGPCNPYPFENYAEITADSNERYGSGRMFSDLRREFTEEDIQQETWFEGSCDNCRKKIRYQHYAVREPYFEGGWIGCYCSFNCVREIMEKRLVDENEAFGLPDELRAEGFDDDDEQRARANRENLLQTKLALVDRFEEEIEKIGIAERPTGADGEEEEEEEGERIDTEKLKEEIQKREGTDFQLDTLPDISGYSGEDE